MQNQVNRYGTLSSPSWGQKPKGWNKTKKSTYEMYATTFDDNILRYEAIYVIKFWSVTYKRKNEDTDGTTHSRASENLMNLQERWKIQSQHCVWWPSGSQSTYRVEKQNLQVVKPLRFEHLNENMAQNSSPTCKHILFALINSKKLIVKCLGMWESSKRLRESKLLCAYLK